MGSRINWLKHVSSWENSGLTKREYCKKHKISLSSLYAAQKDREGKESLEQSSFSKVLSPIPQVESEDRKFKLEIKLSWLYLEWQR